MSAPFLFSYFFFSAQSARKKKLTSKVDKIFDVKIKIELTKLTSTYFKTEKTDKTKLTSIYFTKLTFCDSIHSSSDVTNEVHDVHYQLLQLLEQIVSSTIFVAIDVQATVFVFALLLFLSAQIRLPPSTTCASLTCSFLAATAYNLFAFNVSASPFNFVREHRRRYGLHVLWCCCTETMVRLFHLAPKMQSIGQ